LFPPAGTAERGLFGAFANAISNLVLAMPPTQ